MTDINRVFADFDDADPSKSGGKDDTITVHGRHTVRIDAVRFKESDQYDAVYLIVEFTVVNSNHDAVTPGNAYAWAHNMLNKWYGAANTKQFVAAALGMDPKGPEAKAITRDVVEEAWGESQPLRGQLVELKTTPKVSKSGFDFTIHDWTPAVED